MSGLFDKAKGLLWEDDGAKPASKPAPAASSISAHSTAAPAAAGAASNKFVDALRSAIKTRQTAYTALLGAADKLASVIPDPNMRLKAAYATVAGDGRDVRSVMQALDIHTQDLESQKLTFSRQAEEAMKVSTGAAQVELDGIDPAIKSLSDQIVSLQQQVQTLGESIATKNARKVELTNTIATEQQRFASAKSEFETAMTIVKAELDGQRAVIQSALS